MASWLAAALRAGSAAFLVASGAVAQSEALPAALGPTRLLRPEGGPFLLVRPGAAPALVALRLSVPVDDGELPGAARALGHLAAADLAAAVEAVGGAARIARTPGHAAYSVVGPVRSFDALATALRRAVLAPPFTTESLVRARAEAGREILAMLERPESRTRALLRQRLYLDAAGLEPDASGLELLTLESLRNVWSQQFRPERMHVVVVGTVADPLLWSAFGRWPAPDVPGSPADTVPVPVARPEPQVLRPWAGIGYRLPGADLGAMAVAAELVRRRTAASALAAGRAEVWWHRNGPSLVVLGSADSDNAVVSAASASAPPLRGGAAGEDRAASALVLYLRRMVAEAAALLGPQQVAASARALRSELLLATRTPGELAEFLGAMYDGAGEASAAEGLLRALDHVDAEAVRRILLGMLATTPSFVEVLP